MRRENGLLPNGLLAQGKYVLRDHMGKFIDFDRYKTDLYTRYKSELDKAPKRIDPRFRKWFLNT